MVVDGPANSMVAVGRDLGGIHVCRVGIDPFAAAKDNSPSFIDPMIRSFVRVPVNPFGRMVLALVLTAAAWAAWWVLPGRPIRSHRIENVSSYLAPKPANRGRSIVVAINPMNGDDLDEPTDRAGTLDD